MCRICRNMQKEQPDKKSCSFAFLSIYLFYPYDRMIAQHISGSRPSKRLDWKK